MKNVLSLAALSATLFLLFSCEKNDDELNVSATRIETETDFYEGVLSQYYTYRYDEYNRIIERTGILDYSIGIRTEKIIYKDNKVINYQYYAESDTPNISYNYLNARGFVDSTITFYNDEMRSRIDYAYNTDGYMVRRAYASDIYKLYFTDTYEIENGNRKKAIFLTVFGSPDETTFVPSLQSLRPVSNRGGLTFLPERLRIAGLKSTGTLVVYNDTVLFEYNDKVNTISLVNRGYTWEGKPDKNLIISETDIYDGGTQIYGYGYEFDAKGRVTKKQYSNDNTFQVTFTYTE